MMATRAVFQRVQKTVAAMQAAAEAEDWERFVVLQKDYQRAAAALPALDSVAVNGPECAELVVTLQQIQQALDAVLPLAEARRAFLAAELASTHNAGKLSRTYQP